MLRRMSNHIDLHRRRIDARTMLDHGWPRAGAYIPSQKSPATRASSPRSAFIREKVPTRSVDCGAAETLSLLWPRAKRHGAHSGQGILVADKLRSDQRCRADRALRACRCTPQSCSTTFQRETCARSGFVRCRPALPRHLSRAPVGLRRHAGRRGRERDFQLQPIIRDRRKRERRGHVVMRCGSRFFCQPRCAAQCYAAGSADLKAFCFPTCRYALCAVEINSASPRWAYRSRPGPR